MDRTFSVRFGEEKYCSNKELAECETKEEAVLIVIDAALTMWRPGFSVWLEK